LYLRRIDFTKMSLENQYIQRGKEETTPETPKKPRKSSAKTAPSDEVEKGSVIDKLSQRWDKKRASTITGALLICIAFYCLLACVSYLFTWQIDQNRIIGKGFFDFIFESNTEQVANWNGKLGAWISHTLIFNAFGIASLVIPFLIFLFGLKLLANIQFLPVKKTTSKSLVWMVWSSIFLGYFANYVNFVGGSFGYYINHWLRFTIGEIGTFVFILALLYIVLVVLHNPNFQVLFANLINHFTKEDNEEEEEIVEDEYENKLRIKHTVTPDDLHIINPIKDEDIQNEFISKPVTFDEDDDFDTVVTPIEKQAVPSSLIQEIEDDFESYSNPISPISAIENDDFIIEIPENTYTPTEEHASTLEIASDFVVEIPESEEELSEDETDDLRQEYGDYDPTLDLSGYMLPSIDLLRDWGNTEVSINKQELEDNKNKIVETLSHYKIDIAKIKATVGPTVTLYEIIPAPGVRISKIKNLEDDIALSLSALGIRIIAPIPGKGTIGIEVPNSNPQMVSMRSLIASEKFQNSDFELPVVLGKTITNETYTFDLTKMPHLLVAGSTGQGKSVGLNAILISILYKKHPAQVKFVLIDPKKVELTLYNRIERHFLAKLPGEEDAIITDTSKVVATLNSLCIEMDERYELLKDAQVRTIKEYNAKFIARRLNPEKGHRYMPYIVVLIDEFADLIMTAGKEVEHPIARIAQLARAIGIHLIVATQRPSVNVITGMIKANFPARIAFRVLSKIDSRTILDSSGADQLIGRGDMLISTGQDMIRLQCGFVDTPEVEEICAFIGNQRAYPDALLLPEFIGDSNDSKDMDLGEVDPMFADAARIVVMHQQGSASLLQRKLKLGYNRAGRIVDQLEAFHIIGPFQGSKARDVLYSDEQVLEEYLKVKGLF
jgi:DNA segregation ATPase FtsK/SpoIIIE, S-DNA-T family